MKEIITKVTNFVNENTMLLIGICAFLIIALIVYLIDNSIKTKKMEKAIKEMDETEDKVINSSFENNSQRDATIEYNIKTDEEIQNEPKFDSISLVDEDKELEDTKEEVNEEPVIEPKIEEPVIETPSEPIVETPIVETPPKEESKFTNKKSLSEILAKKKETINNDADKTLEETTDFNNTF